ncbi:hypothetical protein F5146DRAFT_1135346 [Armillaria mellea]|nr:hypothetical protein F5146DRAFT_1135346 [Armillaria mellea]
MGHLPLEDLPQADEEANLDIIVVSLQQISHFATYRASNALPSLSPEVVPYMLELYVNLLKVPKLTTAITPLIKSYFRDSTVGEQCRRVFESVPRRRLSACIKSIKNAGSATSLQMDDLYTALAFMVMLSIFDSKIMGVFLEKNAIKWTCKALERITPHGSRKVPPHRLHLSSVTLCMNYLYCALSADISLAVKPIRHGQLLRSVLGSIVFQVAQEPFPGDRLGCNPIMAIMNIIGDSCMWWPAFKATVTALKSLRKEETQILSTHAELRASWLQMVQKVENMSELHDSMNYVPYCQNPQSDPRL